MPRPLQRRLLPRLGWTLASVGLFAALWELLWLIGWADPKLLPPPHVFLGDIPEQARFFNIVHRWQIGVAADAGPSPTMAVLITVLATTLRVLAGLALAAVGSLLVGVAVRFWNLLGDLTLPTLRLLAPVSPVAWLPVAIFVFGIGNAPAIFMMFIALFFIMTLATITQIDSVPPKYLNVARIMGASKRQIYPRRLTSRRRLPRGGRKPDRTALPDGASKRGESTARSWTSNVVGSPVSGLSSCGGSSGAGGILVLHADTSTIEFTLFAVSSGKALTRAIGGRLDGLNADARFHAEDASGRTVIQVDCADEKPPGHRIAIEFLFNWLEQHAAAVPVLGVGHCVPHGGLRLSGPARIDAATFRYLQGLVPRAPARQRTSVAAIRVFARGLPELPQVACFETAFYLDVPVPEQAPLSKQALHRYGYDGLSFEAVIDALPVIDARAAGGRTIVVHVGDAVSLCALAGGRRVAMVMAFGDPEGSPAMRSPGLDRGLVRHLMTESRMGSLQVRELLRQRSALLGASGVADALDRLVCSDEPRARLVVGFLLYPVSRALGSLVGALAGLDAIVFTAAGGPHAVPIRAAICRKASALGLDLDPAANQAGGPRLTLPGSHVTAWVVPIDKHLLVARRTQTFLG